MKRFMLIIFSAVICCTLLVVTVSAEKIRNPVYAEQINDGIYSIDVKSNSSMFRIIDCQLTVSEGKMVALVTLSGNGYEKLFLGTREDADKASETDFMYFTEDSDGKYTYTIPVEALDKEIECAAFSIRKQKWYDRTIVFESESLPVGTVKANTAIILTIVIVVGIIILTVFAVIIKKRKK